MAIQDLYLVKLKFVAQLYNQDTFSLQSPRTSDMEADSEKVPLWISKITHTHPIIWKLNSIYLQSLPWQSKTVILNLYRKDFEAI